MFIQTAGITAILLTTILSKTLPEKLTSPYLRKKFHTLYGTRVQSSLPLPLILSQINPIQAQPHYFSKTNYNTAASSVPRFSMWSLSFRFPTIISAMHAALLPPPHPQFILTALISSPWQSTLMSINLTTFSAVAKCFPFSQLRVLSYNLCLMELRRATNNETSYEGQISFLTCWGCWK